MTPKNGPLSFGTFEKRAPGPFTYLFKNGGIDPNLKILTDFFKFSRMFHELLFVSSL